MDNPSAEDPSNKPTPQKNSGNNQNTIPSNNLVMKSMDKGLSAINNLLLSVIGQPRNSLETKKNAITDDYTISQTVLGLGINGKVVEVKQKSDGQKYAQKILKDCAKSRREVELHWKSSACKHIGCHGVHGRWRAFSTNSRKTSIQRERGC